MPTKTRTGSIHSFAEGEQGLTKETVRKSLVIPKGGIPVQAIDRETLRHVGEGRLTDAAIDGDFLMGTIAWPEAVDKMAESDDDGPRAHCRFADDGSIRRVWVEVKATCDCGDGCECHSRKSGRRSEALVYAAKVATLHHDYLQLAITKSPPLADPPEDGDEPAHDSEPNTYGLPEGTPIAQKLKAWFKKQLAKLTGWLGRWGKPKLPKSLPSMGRFTAPMAKVFGPILGKYWQEAGRKTLDALGQPEASWDVADPHLAKKIDGAALAFCESANKTTDKTVEEVRLALVAELKEGLVEKGEAIPELIKRVQKVFKGMSESRARAIAVTESARAVNAAQLESAIQSGMVTGKRLLLAAGACKLCRLIKSKEPKEGWPLDAPMFDDGKGNPHYSVCPTPPYHPHCRCTCQYVLIDDLDIPDGMFSGVFLSKSAGLSRR